jgi:hypothetical protein
VNQRGVPWPEITREWREREYTRLRQAVKTLPAIRTDLLDDLFDGTPAPTESKARAVLRNAFAAAAARPDGRRLLAIYVYGLCLDKWERSVDYARIEIVLDALRAVAGGDSEVVSLVVDHAQCVKHAMAVENAMNCSCPVEMQRRADALAAATGSLLERENGLAVELGGSAELLRTDAETQHLYFDAVRGVAASVLEFLEQEASARGDFDDVIRGLVETERAPAVAGDVYQSELRAHRATVAALGERAPQPRIHVDAAEVVYVYPFTLNVAGAGDDYHNERQGRETAEDDLVERSLKEARGWQLGRRGLYPVDVHTLQLTHVWGRAESLEPLYGGVSVRLPTVSVTTTADEMIDYTAEVRVSRLGNHHLRIHSRLEDANLHKVNQTLRRASPNMGQEKLVCDGAEWTRFPQFARDVMKGVADGLSATFLGDPTADFHVVVAARAMSIRRSDGSSSPAAGADLTDAVGASLLFHPVRHVTTSLEEWVRYPSPSNVENLIHGLGYVGDLAVRTANTTLLYMPTSPEWVFDEYEELIEFVASVPPLLTAWENKTSTHASQLQRDLPALEESPPPAVELVRREKQLRELQADVRQDLALLHSPRLVYGPVRREFFDRLWAAAGLPLTESEFERQLGVITTLHERLSAMVSVIAEENRQRIEVYVQLALGLIAAASLAELLSWINEAFNVEAKRWAWMEAGFLVVAAVTVVLIILKRRNSS